MEEKKRAAVLSVADLAAEIGKSELAARRMIERGQIPARKLGDRIVILRSDLDEFLRSLPWDRRFERRRSAAGSVCPASSSVSGDQEIVEGDADAQ